MRGHVFELGTGRAQIRSAEKAIALESLERASVRILARRHGHSKTTIMNIIHRVTATLANSWDVARRLRPAWGGILVVDGKYVRARMLRTLRGDGATRERGLMCFICGVDVWTGDLPHYEIADEETMIDLVLYFQKLKEIGYELRVLVSDGNPDIVRAARKIYGDTLLHQLCTRHYVEGLWRKACEESMHKEPQTQKFIFTIKRIIEADTLDKAALHLQTLKRMRPRLPIHRLILADFKKHADALTTHLQRPDLNIPHTSNDMESVFRQLNIRLKSIGQFMHWRHAREYLNAWALLRRFTKFTDCKGKRKIRNGKTPLECAHVNLRGVNMFQIPRQKQP